MPSGKRQLIRAFRIVGSLALFAAALYNAGLMDAAGWQEVSRVFANASVPFLALSILFIPVMDVVSTVKWKALASARGLSVGFPRLLAFYIVGRFYNLILPSSIGGDLIRVFLLGRDTGRTADAAAVVFVERLTGVVVLLLLAAIALMFTGFGLSRTTLLAGIGFAAMAIAVLCWLLIAERPSRLLLRITQRGGVIDRVVSKIAKLSASILAFRHHNSALLIAIANSFLFYAFAIANVWVAVMVFDQQAGFVQVAIAVPLIMFIMNIPVSIGSLGIMEFGYTTVLMQFGVSGEAALAAALLMRFKLILAGGIGALVNSVMGASPPAPGDITRETQRESGAPNSATKAQSEA
ncbi:MAG: lysylphosphatidylglycerol synthase transmembrane domain-containing protein [Pseudomonadota bacterium]